MFSKNVFLLPFFCLGVLVFTYAALPCIHKHVHIDWWEEPSIGVVLMFPLYTLFNLLSCVERRVYQTGGFCLD